MGENPAAAPAPVKQEEHANGGDDDGGLGREAAAAAAAATTSATPTDGVDGESTMHAASDGVQQLRPAASVIEKNRRKRWLDTHPEYFGPELESADPLLYDRMVRAFQSAEEREQEGRDKGFAGTLRADLLRGEARLAALNTPTASDAFSVTRGRDGELLVEDRDDAPATREEGLARWRWEMEMRFVRGADDDADYAAIDQDEDLDAYNLQGREDAYYDDEEPAWASQVDEHGNRVERELQGETGVQDF
ncbi:hypothetical protein KEM52_005049 [Ascosphaera acerosa]|nr:hypothetical protein KEM52_005049 [Ascosphaera acerosa]